MTSPDRRYQLPPRVSRDDGRTRVAGFELEFSGIDLDAAAAAIRSALGGRSRTVSAAERAVQVDGVGRFNVELDWAYLKRKAAHNGRDEADDAWLERLSQAAALLVPLEVVCPPIPVTELAVLEPMVAALREAGAVGTEESLLAAYGVHINPEIPRLDAPTLLAYLRAYAVLQWWLVDAHAVDTTRKVAPYIDLYPEAYLEAVLSAGEATLDAIFSGYLEHNATRNRALDLLPLLAEIDEARVRRAVDDPRIKPRPAFHYRLPNCHIERADWSPAGAWNTWCVVERLVAQPDELEALAAEFRAARRFLLGVKRSEWVEFVDRWLTERGLV